jgi:DNA-binding MarR family transcriptional regulator
VGNEQNRDAAALPTLTLAVAARLLERSLEDMTLPQFRVLALIASSPERAGRIATLAGVSRPSLTGVLDGLTQRGWVRRVEVDGDRRGVSLEITEDGRVALDRARTDTGSRLDEVLDQLDPEERHLALDGLAALGRAFQAERARRYAAGVTAP